jgi:hypothetical protein
MIGLAATAQAAIIPVWFGIGLVFGFSGPESTTPARRALSLMVNVSAIVLSSLITYALLGMKPINKRTNYQIRSNIDAI